MHTIEIPEKDINIQLPSEWDECSQEQVHRILEQSFQVMAGALSIGEFQIRIFKYLTGIKLGLRYYIRHRLKMSSEINSRIYQLSQQLCGWVFEKQNDSTYELQYKTVVNHFPILNGSLYGPDDLLSDITLGEFKTALSIIDQFFELKDDEVNAMQHLNLFISIIYRQKRNGERVKFHDHLPDPNIVANIPMWQKQCIAIWFTYCVKCLQSEELTINGIDVDLSVLFPSSGGGGNSTTKVNLGWTGILLDIAESGVFGDAVATAQTPLYDVLIFLLKKHQDQKANDKRKTV